MVAGRFYGKPDEGGAILDEKYARKLGLGPGDPVILLGNDAYGSFSMMETTVIGVAREASLPGEAGCVVDLAGFSPVFGLEGKATALSLWFRSERDGRLLPGSAEGPAARAVLDRLASMPALEPRPFSEISASYTAMFEFLDVFMAGMMAIFGIVASVGIANAILLSVQERTRDLGTLRAIALTSRQAGMLVQAETLMTGIGAALCAFGLGLLVVWLAERTGVGIRIDISEVGAALPETLRPRLYPGRVAAIAAMTAVFPVLAAVLPSAMARKLTIRESLGS